jgi:hypothetical protein
VQLISLSKERQRFKTRPSGSLDQFPHAGR